jgi:uncharacterized protein
MELSHYIKIFPYKEDLRHLILYSTLTTSTVLLEKEVIDRIRSQTLAPTEEESLVDLGFLVSDIDKEKKEILELLEKINENNKRLSLVSIMNLNCNLSCIYCFEGDMKGKLYMGRDTADLLIDFISKRLSLYKKILNVDFYGGEPLLSLDLIKYISSRLGALARKRGIDYKFNLVTNGVLLTRKTVESLVPLGLKSVKITLDGPKDIHDKCRPFKSGAGSFDIIIKNIKDVCHMVKVNVGGNYSEKNYRRFPELLDFMVSEGLTADMIPNVKFDPLIKTDNWEAPVDFRDGCESIKEPWLTGASLYLREEILKRGFNTPEIGPAPCMIDIKDEFVVNYDGTIYKCPGFIGKKGYEIGSLENGVVNYSDTYHLDLWNNEQCIDCEYLPLCFGGCRYMKLLRDDNLEGVDCKKEYLDATLEAFINQDIKYRHTS